MKNNFDDLRLRMKQVCGDKAAASGNVVTKRKRKPRTVSHTRESRLSVSIGGRIQQVKVQKRPYTGHCELCLSKTSILSYHHWNDNNLCKGLWLCSACHRFAEYIDSHLKMINRYLALKRRADADVLGFDFKPVTVANTDTPLIDTLLSYILVGGKDKENRVEPKEVVL